LNLSIRKAIAFYSRQSANFKILNIRTTLGTFLGNLTSPYNQVYAKELGASPVDLGYLSSLGAAFAASLSLPGGFLADRCGRKKLYVIGSLLGLLTPLTYFLAPSWMWVAPAYIFSNVMIALRRSAYQAIYAGSVNSEDRGRAFGIGSMLSSLPVILAPIIAVKLMGDPSTVTARAIRPLYLIQLVGLLVLLAFVLFFLKEEQNAWKSLRSAFSARDKISLFPFVVLPALLCIVVGALEGVDLALLLLPTVLITLPILIFLLSWRKSRREMTENALRRDIAGLLALPGVKPWLAMKGTGAAAMGLANPFWLVYAAYVVGVSPGGLAMMVSLRMVGRLLSAIPWGIASDRRGRKFTLIFGRVFMHVGILSFIFASRQWLLILGYAVMGIADGSTSVWTVIRMELVPDRSRSVMASMDQFVWYFPVIVSALVGGIVYTYAPKLIFVLCLLIDAGVRMPLVAFGVPETSKARKQGN